MNAQEVIRRGHVAVLEAVSELPEEHWYRPGVCGVWSVRDILAHLAAFEHMVIQVLQSFVTGGPTTLLDRQREDGERFNEVEVAARRQLTAAEVLAEYSEAHGHAIPLVAQIPLELCRQPGTIPGYGADYSLEDLIVHKAYGHKREHAAQVNVYRDELAQVEAVAEGGYTVG